MVSGNHTKVPAGYIHRIPNWDVADETARDALVVTADDIGKVAWQQDDDTFWMLADDTGPTWVGLGGGGGGGGSGDVVGPASSVDGEIALFDSTTGKLLKRASNTGLIKATSGVIATATAGTDYYNPGGTDVAVADGGTGASSASAARTNLGLVIGVDVQQQDDELSAIAALVSAADKLPYFTGAGIASLADLSAFARTILDDADAATVRATIGAGTGGGDASTNTSTSVDGEVALFNGTSGKSIKRGNSLTGVVKAASGVLSAAAQLAIADGGTGQATAAAARKALGAATEVHWLSFVMNGSGTDIATGVKGYIKIPVTGKITEWEVVATESGGSITIDLWADTYANFPPVVGDSITTSEKPTLTTAQKNTDTSLNGGSGWAVTQGSWLVVNVDSCSGVTVATLALKLVED